MYGNQCVDVWKAAVGKFSYFLTIKQPSCYFLKGSNQTVYFQTIFISILVYLRPPIMGGWHLFLFIVVAQKKKAFDLFLWTDGGRRAATWYPVRAKPPRKQFLKKTISKENYFQGKQTTQKSWPFLCTAFKTVGGLWKSQFWTWNALAKLVNLMSI